MASAKPPRRQPHGEAPHPAHHHSTPHLAEPTETPPGEDWLEVFYDLIFGVAIIELCEFLAREPGPDLGRFAVFVGLMLPLWWVWVGWTIYTARFDADDTPHRLLTFVQMLAIAAMSVQIHDAHTGSAIFAGAYVVARVSLLLLYVRAKHRVPAAAPVVRIYLRGFGLGAALWAVSVFTPPPWRFVLWVMGMAVDMVTPWVYRSGLQKFPLDASHFLDRLGAFTSIVLGVAVAGVVTGVADMNWNIRAVISAVLGFTIAVCLWWIRAEFVGRSSLHKVGSGQPTAYVHMPMVVSLATISVGVQLAIIRAATGEHDSATFWLLGGGSALWVVSNAVVNFVLMRRRAPRLIAAYVAAFVVSAAIPFLPDALPAPMAMALLTAVYIALVLAECGPKKAGSGPARQQGVS